MDNQERFENIVSVLPQSYECDIDDDKMTVRSGNKSVDVIFTGNSYVVGKRELKFNVDNEYVNTILVPMIMSAIDGKERI